MLPDLEHLIKLQRLENSAGAARARIDELPVRLDTLKAQIDTRSETVTVTKQRLDDHKTDRLALEKELAQVQTRLTRFKEQLMEVRTNKEYQAMQTEIAGGEEEIRRLEDRVLERMLQADDLAAEVQRAETQLADERSVADKERAALERERGELERQLERCAQERSELAGAVSRAVISLFETVTRQRKGVAVVEARDGRCSSCQVRLRPQLFNDVRSNSSLIQCESCQRFLYFSPGPSAPTGGAAE